MDKQQLRIWAKEERKKLDIKALSDELVKNLQDTEEYKQAKNIMLFYPKKDEINLLSILCMSQFISYFMLFLMFSSSNTVIV